MITHETGLADRLNELLDARSSSGSSWQQQVRNDLEFATTVDQVRALDDAPAADPRFAQNLLQSLLADLPAENHAMVAVTHTHAPERPVPSRAALKHVPPSSRTMPAAFAAAMLVLLILATSLVLLRPGWSARPSGAPILLPALNGSPDTLAVTPPAGQPGVPLLHLVLPESSAARAFVSLERYTLPPSASMELDVRVGNTPMVSYIVAGEVQTHLDDASPSARVVRAGGTRAEDMLTTGETTTLAGGDALVVPEHGVATVTNETAGPAEVLLLFQPTGVPAVLSTAGDFATLGTQVHTVSAPLTLDLRQVTLAPGAAVARSEDPQVVQIAGSLDPARVMDVRTASGGALRNAGKEALEVYVLTVTSAGLLP